MAYPVSPDESERIAGFAKLVGQLKAMIQDSGDPTNFDARVWWRDGWLSRCLLLAAHDRSSSWTPWRAKTWFLLRSRRPRAGHTLDRDFGASNKSVRL
jgi:hypothetical protein